MPGHDKKVQTPFNKPFGLSDKKATGTSPLPPLGLDKIKPKKPVVKPGFGKFDLADKKKVGPVLPPQIVDKLKPKGPGIKPQIDDFKLAPPKQKPKGPGNKKPADQKPDDPKNPGNKKPADEKPGENPGDKKPADEKPGEGDEPADQPEGEEEPHDGGKKWPDIVVQFFPNFHGHHTTCLWEHIVLPQVSPLVTRDVQLIKVERVDDGFKELDLGPMVRVSVRSNADIYRAFDVAVIAGLDGKVLGNSPAATARIDGISAGEVIQVDLRLPPSAHAVALDELDQPIAFNSLFTIVDSRNEILEFNEANNIGSRHRDAIPFVDLVVSQVDPESPVAGGQLMLSGEGFANAAPSVIAAIGGFKFQLPVVDHSPYGVIVELPSFTLVKPAIAQVVVVREDGQTSEVIDVAVNP